jgi:hypothetical protein
VHEDAFSYEAKGGNMTKGQQAFPGKEHYGMTLRDWFAGQALCGYCSTTKLERFSGDDIALICYRIADDMLKVREKGKK